MGWAQLRSHNTLNLSGILHLHGMVAVDDGSAAEQKASVVYIFHLIIKSPSYLPPGPDKVFHSALAFPGRLSSRLHINIQSLFLRTPGDRQHS